MNRRTPFTARPGFRPGWRSYLSLIVILAVFVSGLTADAITFIGRGDGRTWGVAANWDTQRVPAASDDVLIPENFGVVEYLSGSTTVQSLQAPAGLRLAGGVLTLTEGASRISGTFLLEDNATLIVTGPKSQLVLDGKSSSLSGSLRALRGAAIELGPATRVDGATQEWTATGAGSVINARALTSVTLSADGWLTLTADDQGRIDLSGLTALQGPLRPAATRNGVVDLSSARGRWSSSGYRFPQTIRAESGGRVLCPGITEYLDGHLTVRSDGLVPVEQWTNIDGATLNFADGAVGRFSSLRRLGGLYPSWTASGIGTLIDARAVTNVNLNTDGWWPFSADNEARIDLSGLTEARGPLRPTATRGGLVDLSGLRGRWTSAGYRQPQILRAESKGRVECPGLTEFEEGQIILRSEGVLPLDKLSSVNGSSLTLSDGAVLRLPSLRRLGGLYPDWSASGIGTLLDTRWVTELALDVDGWWSITADSQGRIDLSGLASIRGPARPVATRGGEVDLSGVRGQWSSAGFRFEHILRAESGGRILCPGITSFVGGRIQVRGSDSVLAVEQITGITDTELDYGNGAVGLFKSLKQIGGTTPDWSATGFGTLIDASAVAEVVLSADGWFPLAADGEAQINLGGLTTLRGPLRPAATRGGVIDLSGLRGRWTGAGYRYAPTLRAESSGRIVCGGITEFEEGQITLRGDGSIPLEQLTSLDGSTLDLGDGAVARLSSLRRLGGINPNWTAAGVGTLLEAVSLTQVDLNPTGWWPITADNEARIDLTGLTSVAGPLRPTASRGGIIDLSGLRGGWSGDGFRYSPILIASSRGQILCRGLQSFDHGEIRVQSEALITTEPWVQLLDSLVVADGFNAVVNFGSLRNHSGTTFEERNGGRIVFSPLSRIVTQPSGTRVSPGGNVTLEVVAAGDPPVSYQWFKNGQPLEGQVSATLRLDNIAVSDAGSYTVIISNPAGSIESEPALVGIQLPTLPFADVFAQRGRITSAAGVGIADSSDATRELNEPRHAGKRGGRSIWITWKAPATGVVTLATEGSGFDTLLAVYTGNSLTSLTPVASDEDSGRFLTSRVRFNAVADVEYQIAVDGYAGTGGSTIFGWNFEANALALLPEIVRQPTGALVVEGDPVGLAVIALPVDATYQWYFNGTALRGETRPTLSLPSFRPDLSGTYHVLVTAPNGASIESRGAILEGVSRPEARGAPSADKLDDLFPEDAGVGPFAAALHGLDLASPPVSVGLPGSQWTDNTGSSRGPDDPPVCVALTTATRWFRLQFNVPGAAPTPVTVTTDGSAIAALLAVFTNRFAPAMIACDAAAPPTQPSASVTFPARRGEDYLVLVDGIDGAEGRIRLNWDGQEEVPAQVTLQDGRLSVELRVVPGEYDWDEGPALGTWQNLFRTNVASGIFRYQDPNPASQAARFFRIVPANPAQ